MRAVPLLLGIAGAVMTHPGIAGAELSAIGSGDLVEAGYHLDVEIRGLVAVCEARQTILNQGVEAAEARYTFALPGDAVIDRLTVTPAKGSARAAAVPADAAVTLAADAHGLATMPDLGLLRLIEDGAPPRSDQPGRPATYELRLYPVPAAGTLTATVRWIQPLSVDGGRVLFQLPGRAAAANLSRETGRVRFRAVPGVRDYLDVHAGGALLAARAGARALPFAAPRGDDLRIDASPDIAGAAPVAWYDALPVATGGVVALSAIAPRVPRADPLADRRILIVADVSRSLGPGREAAARAVDAVLAAASPSARIEAVVFDRTARRVFGSWRPATAHAELVAAIRSAEARNGSDLRAALDLAAVAVTDGDRDGAGPTLVVIVSDGILPTATDGDDVSARLGGTARHLDVASLVLVPDAAPMPDLRWGPLAELSRHYGGRTLALRLGDVERRAATLAAELREPEPLANLTVEADGARLDGIDLSGSLAPGSGLVALASYAGRPRALRVTALRGDQTVSIAARSFRDGGASLALARATSYGVAGTGDVPGAERAIANAEQALREARRARMLVDRARSLVALAASSINQQRLALVAAGGPFTRVAPPAELAVERPFLPVQALPVDAARAVPGGSLDDQIVRDLMTRQLVPRARGCLSRALVGGAKVAGTLVVELELTRGEMMAARPMPSSFFHPVLTPCVIDAAYQLNVPAYPVGSDPDPIYVVRYPLRFETRGQAGITVLGDADSTEPIDTGVKVDAVDPMGNLRNEPRP